MGLEPTRRTREMGLEPTRRELEMGSEPTKAKLNRELGLEPTRRERKMGLKPTRKVAAILEMGSDPTQIKDLQPIRIAANWNQLFHSSPSRPPPAHFGRQSCCRIAAD